jgi:hypothetical protein
VGGVVYARCSATVGVAEGAWEDVGRGRRARFSATVAGRGGKRNDASLLKMKHPRDLIS